MVLKIDYSARKLHLEFAIVHRLEEEPILEVLPPIARVQPSQPFILGVAGRNCRAIFNHISLSRSDPNDLARCMSSRMSSGQSNNSFEQESHSDR
jgi:hypothetical protein